MSDATTVLLCGVGGQGTVLAADLLARAALGSGHAVKVSEIHGMAQRGGAVTTVVRFGSDVRSMVCDPGCADVVVSFETTEALRNVAFLKRGGRLLVADETIVPLPVACGDGLHARRRPRAAGGLWGRCSFPPRSWRARRGTAKAGNVVLLGALSTALDFPRAAWEAAIVARVPEKTVEANLAAFRSGAAFAGGEGGGAR